LEMRMLASAQLLAEEQMRRLPSADSREREMPIRALAAEIGAATRVNDRAVQARMGDAAALVERFPLTVAALAEGRIDKSHVDVIQAVGTSLPAGEVLD